MDCELTCVDGCTYEIQRFEDYCIKWTKHYNVQIAGDVTQLDMTPYPAGKYCVLQYDCDCPCDEPIECCFFWPGIEAGEGKTNVEL